jgi:hypothetical protein
MADRLPLTREIRITDSPVRQYIESRFPLREQVQLQYRESVGPIVVDGDPAVNAGTLGGAFDWMVRFRLAPSPPLSLARLGAIKTGRPALIGLYNELQRMLSDSVDDLSTEELARGCWALSLFTEFYRALMISQSPLYALSKSSTIEDLLAVAPAGAVDQLRALIGLAQTELLPSLASRSGMIAIGPTFEGSALMNADADLVVAGMLVEVKTALGHKRADGSRRSGLDSETIRQVLGYVLLDFSNEFEMADLAIYAARFGKLVTWPLLQLLCDLAGERIDLAAERATFKSILNET